MTDHGSAPGTRAAGTWGLFTGTLLVGSGVAVVNVLLPAVVKSDFGHHLPLATGLATSSMALSASLGAGLAQPLREVTGGPVSSLAVVSRSGPRRHRVTAPGQRAASGRSAPDLGGGLDDQPELGQLVLLRQRVALDRRGEPALG